MNFDIILYILIHRSEDLQKLNKNVYQRFQHEFIFEQDNVLNLFRSSPTLSIL